MPVVYSIDERKNRNHQYILYFGAMTAMPRTTTTTATMTMVAIDATATTNANEIN